MTISRFKPSSSQELEGGRGHEDPDHGPHGHLVDGVDAALDAALTDQQGHEQRDHRYETGVVPGPAVDGHEADGDPSGEGVRRARYRFDEEHYQDDQDQRDEREVARRAAYALQSL